MWNHRRGAGLCLVWLGLALLHSAPAISQAAITASTSEGGSAVVVPYYTVNDGWSTLINLTNTSRNSLAVKLRLLEARNGRDVLNFTVLLAPTDVWAGWLTADAMGRPVVRTNDRSCTVPLQLRDDALTADELAYSTSLNQLLPPGEPGRFTDHTATNGDPSRMSEGYIEIVTMGEAQRHGAEETIPWYASPVDGEPRDCARVEAAFGNQTDSWEGGISAIPGEAGSGDPVAREEGNYRALQSAQPLRVNVSLVNKAGGFAAGIPSTHLAGWGLGQNLVTATAYPWRLEPTLAAHEGLWSTGGLGAVDEALKAVEVGNEWTRNPATGASSDWVLTFPTKRYQSDEHVANVAAGCSAWRHKGSRDGGPDAVAGEVFDGWPEDDPDSPREVLSRFEVTGLREHLCPRLGHIPFQQDNDGRAEIYSVAYRILDRETGHSPWIEPAPGSAAIPPYAANVISIGSGTAESALRSAVPLFIDTGALGGGASNGWLRYRIAPEAGLTTRRAATGFVFKLRDFGDPSRNFSQATPHAYKR